jgi:hypothetical protein
MLASAPAGVYHGTQVAAPDLLARPGPIATKKPTAIPLQILEKTAVLG